MASIPLVAQPAPVSHFDPAAWLDSFKAVGGWWIVTPDGHMSIGWHLDGFTSDQNEQACNLWRQFGRRTDWRSAISSHILAGSAGHA